MGRHALTVHTGPKKFLCRLPNLPIVPKSRILALLAILENGTELDVLSAAMLERPIP